MAKCKCGEEIRLNPLGLSIIIKFKEDYKMWTGDYPNIKRIDKEIRKMQSVIGATFCTHCAKTFSQPKESK